MKKAFVVLIALVVFAAVGFGWSYTQAGGCCSGHGGTAGCSFHRIVCNDGWYSSCNCRADDLKIDVQ